MMIRRGLEHYVAKHNRYSTLEARAAARELAEPVKESSAAGAGGSSTKMGEEKHSPKGAFPWVAPVPLHVRIPHGFLGWQCWFPFLPVHWVL